LQNEQKPSNLGPLRRAFTVMALENCDILTLSKQDLARMESEFEDMVSEMFLNAHKKISKTMRIKEETENAYIMNKVTKGHNNILNN
jgi:CRP-like cAMP-binding protein